jgi:hypothetical protein
MRMGLEGGTETEEELMSCAHLMNKKKTEALLVCPSGLVSNNAQLKIVVPGHNVRSEPRFPVSFLCLCLCP